MVVRKRKTGVKVIDEAIERATPEPLKQKEELMTPAPNQTPLPPPKTPAPKPKSAIADKSIEQEKATKLGVPVEAFIPPDIPKSERAAYLQSRPRFEAPTTIEEINTRKTLAAGVGQNVPFFEGEAPSTLELAKGALPELGAAAGGTALAGAAGVGAAALVGGSIASGGILPIAIAAISSIRLVSELKSEFQEETTNAYSTFAGKDGSRNNLKAIINEVNAGRLAPDDAVELFNQELGRIDRAERILSGLSEKDWLSRNKKELTNIENFNRFTRPMYVQQLQQAIVAPNPSTVLPLDSGEEVANV